MTASEGYSLEEFPQPLNRQILTLVSLTPGVILTIDATQGTVRKEDRARTAAPADRGFFPKMGTMTKDAGVHTRFAITNLSGKPVHMTFPRA